MRHAGPVALLLLLMILPQSVCWYFLAGTKAIIASWILVVAISALLLSMFSSVLFKGLGAGRSIPTVLVIASTGIGSLITQFSFLYHWTGLLDPAGERSTSLLEALYFSVVTWTTLGYGDFLPADAARYIVIVEALLGYVTMALLIVVLVSVIERARR